MKGWLFLFSVLVYAPGFIYPAFGNSTGHRTVSLRFLSMKDEIENLWIRSEGEWTSPRIPSTYLPVPLKYTGTSPLIFFRKQLQENGEEGYLPVGSVEIPGNQKELLLFLSESPDNKIITRVVDSGQDSFPNGSYKFFNLCDRMVGLALEDELIRLAPESMQVFKPTLPGAQPVSVQFMKAGDLEQESLTTTSWYYQPEVRRMVFLIPDGKRIRIRSMKLYEAPAEN